LFYSSSVICHLSFVMLRSSPEQLAMHSMTGYGRAQASAEGVAVVVEI
jgi:hypothetical protein